MKILSIIYVILLLATKSVYGQSIDELESKINATSGLEKAQYQLKLSNTLLGEDNDRSFTLAKDALSNFNGNKSIEGASYALMAQSSLQSKSFQNAIQYGKSAATIYLTIDKKNYALCESIVADAYESKGKTTESITHNKLAYTAYLSLGKNKKAAYRASSIGIAYNELKNTKKAIEWYQKAATQFEKSENYKNQVKSLKTLGALYSNYGDYASAKKSLEAALTVAKNNNLSISELESALDLIAENEKNETSLVSEYKEEQVEMKEAYISEITINHAKSLSEIEQMSEEMQLAELKIKAQQDEANILTLENQALALEKSKIETEKNLAKAKELEAKAEKAKAVAEAKAQSAKAKNLWIAVGSLVVVAGLVFIGFVKKRKSNQILQLKNTEISTQKDEIESKSKSIAESIDYATRIQKAMLPPPNLLKNILPNSFVFLKPKDVVSGDFFWYHQVGSKLIAVAADCTGHGVPGAFMSIIFSNILDKIIIDENILSPEQILETTCAILTQKLLERNVENESFKDGMDVSVVCIDPSINKLTFSGAKNGIYIVSSNELKELKGTRRSVGLLSSTAKKQFTLHTYDYQKGDKVFMYSDGFADQKGGTEGTKFYYKPFRDLLTRLSENTIMNVPDAMHQEFEKWKGTYEQYDDVMIVGLEL